MLYEQAFEGWNPRGIRYVTSPCFLQYQFDRRWIWQQNQPPLLSLIERLCESGQHRFPDVYVRQGSDVYSVPPHYDKRAFEFHNIPGVWHARGHVAHCVHCGVTRNQASRSRELAIEEAYQAFLESDDDLPVLPGSSPETELKPTELLIEDVTFDCPICLESACGKVSFDCSHSFCGACTQQWLVRSHRCPLCRQYMQQTRSVECDIAPRAESPSSESSESVIIVMEFSPPSDIALSADAVSPVVVSPVSQPDRATVRTRVRGGKRSLAQRPGFCYLKPVPKRLRDEAVRVLGRTPRSADVARFYAGHAILPRNFRFLFVGQGTHVLRDVGWPSARQWSFIRTVHPNRRVGSADPTDFEQFDLPELSSLLSLVHPIDFFSLAEMQPEPRFVRAPGSCWKKIDDIVFHPFFEDDYEPFVGDVTAQMMVDKWRSLDGGFTTRARVEWDIQPDGDFHVYDFNFPSKLAGQGTRSTLEEFHCALEANLTKYVGEVGKSTVDAALSAVLSPEVRVAAEKSIQPDLVQNFEHVRRLCPWAIKPELTMKMDELSLPYSAFFAQPHPHAVHASIRRWAMKDELSKHIKCDTTIVGMKEEHFAMLRDAVPDDIELTLVNPIVDHKDISRFARGTSVSSEVFTLPAIKTPGIYFDEQGHYLSAGFLTQLVKDNPNLVSVGYSSIFPLEALEFESSPDPEFVEWTIVKSKRYDPVPTLIYTPEGDRDGTYVQPLDPTPIVMTSFSDPEQVVRFSGGVVAGKSHYRIHMFTSYNTLPQVALVTAEYEYTTLPKVFYDQPSCPPIRVRNLVSLFLYARVINTKLEENLAGKIRLFAEEKKMYLPFSSIDLIIKVIIKILSVTTVGDMMSRDTNSLMEELYKKTVGAVPRWFKRVTSIRRAAKNAAIVDFHAPIFVYPGMHVTVRRSDQAYYGVSWKSEVDVPSNLWTKFKVWFKAMGMLNFDKHFRPVIRNSADHLVFPHVAATELMFKLYGPRFVRSSQIESFQKTYQGGVVKARMPDEMLPSYLRNHEEKKKQTIAAVRKERKERRERATKERQDRILAGSSRLRAFMRDRYEADIPEDEVATDTYVDHELWSVVEKPYPTSKSFETFVRETNRATIKEYHAFCELEEHAKTLPSEEALAEKAVRADIFKPSTGQAVPMERPHTTVDKAPLNLSEAEPVVEVSSPAVVVALHTAQRQILEAGGELPPVSDTGVLECIEHGCQVEVGESGPHYPLNQLAGCDCAVAAPGDHVISGKFKVIRRGLRWTANHATADVIDSDAKALQLHRQDLYMRPKDRREAKLPSYETRVGDWEKAKKHMPQTSSFERSASGETLWDTLYGMAADRRHKKVPYAAVIEYPRIPYPANDCLLVAMAIATGKSPVEILFHAARAFPARHLAATLDNLPLEVLHPIALKFGLSVRVQNAAGHLEGNYGVKLSESSVVLKYDAGHITLVSGVRQLLITRDVIQRPTPEIARKLVDELKSWEALEFFAWRPERKRANDYVRAIRNGEVSILGSELTNERIDAWDILTDAEPSADERYMAVIMGDPGCRKSSTPQRMLMRRAYRKPHVFAVILATSVLAGDWKDKLDAQGTSSPGAKLPGDTIATLDRALAKNVYGHVIFTDENKFPKGYHSLLGFINNQTKYFVFMCDPWQSSWHHPTPTSLNDPGILGEAEFYMNKAKFFIAGTWRFSGLTANFWRMPSFGKETTGGYIFMDTMPSTHLDLLEHMPYLREADVFVLWEQRTELYAAHFRKLSSDSSRQSDSVTFTGSQGLSKKMVIIEIDDTVIMGGDPRIIYTAMTRSRFIVFVRKWRPNGRSEMAVAAHPVFSKLEHYRQEYTPGARLRADPKYTVDIREASQMPFPANLKIVLAGPIDKCNNWQFVQQFHPKIDPAVDFIDPDAKKAGARLRRDDPAYADQHVFQAFIDETDDIKAADALIAQGKFPVERKLPTKIPVASRAGFEEQHNADVWDRGRAELYFRGQMSEQFKDVYALRKDAVEQMSQMVKAEPAPNRRIGRLRVVGRLAKMGLDENPLYYNPQAYLWGADQRANDSVSYALARRQRIQYATKREIAHNMDSQKQFGLAVFGAFMKYLNFSSPVPWDQAKYEQCIYEFQDRRGSRTHAEKMGSRNRAHYQQDEMSMVMKQQWKLKDRVFKPAKPGQPIMTHSDQYLFEHGPYGIYLLDKLLEHAPPYWYFHAKKTVNDYANWNRRYLAGDAETEMVDLTGQDGTTQGWAVHFFENLMRYFSLPEAFIAEFVRNKMSKRVRDKLLMIMTNSGEIWTYLINSTSGTALECFKYDIPPGLPMAGTGDDIRRRTGLVLSQQYRAVQSQDPTLAKRFVAQRGEFVSFLSIGQHTFKDPIILLRRMLGRLNAGSGQDAALGYFDLWKWNYNQGEVLASCFDEPEMEAHAILTRIMFNLRKEGIHVKPDWSQLRGDGLATEEQVGIAEYVAEQPDNFALTLPSHQAQPSLLMSGNRFARAAFDAHDYLALLL